MAGVTHDKISTGQADSKFGFSMEQSRVAIDRLRASRALKLVGLHFHIGSQLFELEPFRAAVRAIAQLGDFPVYNLGGGLAAAYTAGQHPPTAEAYVEAIVSAAHAELGPGKRLLLEPGRALVANSDCHPLHRGDGQAQRVDLGRRRRRHVGQPAPDAL